MSEVKNQCIPKIGEVLDDRSSTGRRRPWSELKVSNELLSSAYDDVDKSKAERLRHCCEFVQFSFDPGTGRKTLSAANFCRVRLCPICSWRRSLKAQAQMMQIAQFIENDPNLKVSYILLTLTVENVGASELSSTIDLMMKGWDRLSRRKRYKDAVLGHYRALEITHNVITDEFHPHFHVLLCVDKNYYKRGYLTQVEWCEFWKKALRVDYTPICDVRRVKGTDAAAIAEIAKYPAKPQDYILPNDWDMTVETVRVLDKALAHRRLLSYGGLIADVHRKLHLDDMEDGDMVHLDAKLEDDSCYKFTYFWYSGYRQYRYDERD